MIHETLEKFDFVIDVNKISTTIPTLFFGDSLKIMRHIPKKSIDLIIADEGYPDLEEHRAIGTTTRLTQSKGSNEKFYKIVQYQDTIPLYKKLLKPTRHLYIWRPSLNQKSLYYWDLLINPSTGLLIKNGFQFRKSIPCVKNYMGMGYSFRSAHERLILADNILESDEIIFAYKKNGVMRKLNDMDIRDVFLDEWKPSRSKSKTHVSQKPSGIYRKLISASSVEGEIILEPFAGSFQAGIVNTKHEMNRRVIGIEIDRSRLEDTKKNFKHETGLDLNVINFDKKYLN